MRPTVAHSFLLSLLIAGGCSQLGDRPQATPAPKQTTLELRDYQTATFETNELSLITKVILDVLRDDGFVIGTYDRELGIINASKLVNFGSRDDARKAFQELGVELKANKRISIDLSANISQFGTGSRVRLIFRVNVLRKSGQVKDTAVASSPESYRVFFRKVQQGLFLQSQQL
jgi:hypothetical protein